MLFLLLRGKAERRIFKWQVLKNRNHHEERILPFPTGVRVKLNTNAAVDQKK